MRLLFLSALLTSAFLAAPRSAPTATMSLDGDWNFVPDPEYQIGVGQLATAGGVRTARVPGSWQSEFADLRDYAGVAWYWRTVKIDPPAPGHVVLLRFGAVDYRADVFVNGQSVGTHEGGYLPFEFDITPRLRPGENQIALRVVDPGAKLRQVEGIDYAQIPHGKQNWYVQTSGPWQSVELDVRPALRLDTVHISAGADGHFKIDAAIIDPRSAPAIGGQLYAGAEILDPGGKSVWKQAQTLAAHQARCQFSGVLSNPELWSLDHPALYTLNVWLNSGDAASYHFGFRTFESRGGKFYLNGKVLYLRGALDQAFYPDTVYTPPSLQYLIDEMRKAKELGLNLVRCHIKVPDPRYLEAADKTGILVWYEIPSWDKLTPESERRALETLRGMVDRDWNHPSIALVSLINESWGADLNRAADRAWLRQTYEQAKRLVPGWLVDDNSACCRNFHVESDLADFHQYDAIPDHAGDFDRLVSDLAMRPAWLFSPYGDAKPRGDEPLVLSEFGNWGLPQLPQQKPWWFSRDFEGREITLPEGYDRRFADYLYSTLFPDVNALAAATEEREYESLQYEIESLRSHPEIQGYVITELTDVNWESNGLMDMTRRPKVFSGALAQLQRDDLVWLRLGKRNYYSGDRVTAEIDFSHYGDLSLAGAKVNWQLEGTGEAGSAPLPEVPEGGAGKIGTIAVTVPAVPSPTVRALKIEVEAQGRIVTQNSVQLFFYPPKPPDLPPAVAFHDPAGRLRRLVEEMRSRNYVAPSPNTQLPVLVTSTFDAEVRKALEGGGRVVLISADHLTLAPGLEIVPRHGSDLDGNWISSFSWVRKDQEPFRSIAFSPLPGWESQAATPQAVVRGVPAADFKDVLAGLFYGWIRWNVGTLVQAKVGRGRLLICTYALANSYGVDPYSTYLLDAVMNYVVCPDFNPTFTITL